MRPESEVFMHRWITVFVVATLMVVSASAETLIIPASANVEGANQTRWRTDLEIKAENDESAAFTIELLESGTNNSDPVSVDGAVGVGQSVRFENLLEETFGFTGSGALRITTTSGRILATSRTFNDDPAGTFGQTIPAVPEGRATTFDSDTTLIQLSRSSDPTTGFRTNIGVVNTVGESIDMEFELRYADGSVINTLTRTLRPLEHRQINDIFNVAGAGDVGDGYAIVRTTTENGAFIAYASVVDNGSGDAVFILGSADDCALEVLDDRFVVFEAFMRPG
jgi:hypothetical protein